MNGLHVFHEYWYHLGCQHLFKMNLRKRFLNATCYWVYSLLYILASKTCRNMKTVWSSLLSNILHRYLLWMNCFWSSALAHQALLLFLEFWQRENTPRFEAVARHSIVGFYPQATSFTDIMWLLGLCFLSSLTHTHEQTLTLMHKNASRLMHISSCHGIVALSHRRHIKVQTFKSKLFLVGYLLVTVYLHPWIEAFYEVLSIKHSESLFSRVIIRIA